MSTGSELEALGNRILVLAGFKIGGAALAKRLGVTDDQLARWLVRKDPPPFHLILKALEVLEPDTHHDEMEVRSAASSE